MQRMMPLIVIGRGAQRASLTEQSDSGLQEGRRQDDCDFYYRDRSEETRGAEDKVVGL